MIPNSIWLAIRVRVVKNLAKDEERLTQWYKDNSLQVNFDKYQCMLLGCENTERTINFAIDGEYIEQTQSIKILGVHIRAVFK